MPIKSVKMKISKNKKMRFFLMSQGSLNPKIKFLGQKMCSVARLQTDTQTTEGTLSGFQKFFLQPIIKNRLNMMANQIFAFRQLYCVKACLRRLSTKLSTQCGIINIG